MKVFLGTTTAQWKKYQNNYVMINNYLKEIGCIIHHDWISWMEKNYDYDYKNRNINKIFEIITKAIDETDIVIIEYTVPNFSSSHQINYALMKKKPVLILRLKKDNPKFNDSYLDALSSPLLTIQDYNKKNYKSIIDDFIGFSLEEGQNRYNIVLGKKEKLYLDWASNEYKKSRSFIIRSLIDKEMDSDYRYKKYKDKN